MKLPKVIANALKQVGAEYELIKTKDHYLLRVVGIDGQETVGNNSSKVKGHHEYRHKAFARKVLKLRRN